MWISALSISLFLSGPFTHAHTDTLHRGAHRWLLSHCLLLSLSVPLCFLCPTSCPLSSSPSRFVFLGRELRMAQTLERPASRNAALAAVQVRAQQALGRWRPFVFPGLPVRQELQGAVAQYWGKSMWDGKDWFCCLSWLATPSCCTGTDFSCVG